MARQLSRPFAVPAGLAAQASLGPRWSDWLDRLPRLVADLLGEWGLTFDGLPLHGYCSVVVPVRTPSGRPAMLKVTFDGDDESLHEALALQHWHGNGTVRLLRAEPHRRALLLERLHQEDLRALADVPACEVVAGFYHRIHLAAMPQLRPLTGYVRAWNEGLRELGRDAPMPRRLVQQALSLADSFVADPTSTGVVVHGDLHYENVLAADRERWLVIDPKPMSGDAHYEVAPLLWNRWDEAAASGEVRDSVRRRFHAVVDTAGLDEDRARDWVVVRAIHNGSWAVADAKRLGRRLAAVDQEWITRMLAVAKAVQD